MPFKSQAQRRKLWATNPEVARKWESLTPNSGALPERVKSRAKSRKRKGPGPSSTPTGKVGVGRTLGRRKNSCRS